MVVAGGKGVEGGGGGGGGGGLPPSTTPSTTQVDFHTSATPLLYFTLL